MTDATPSQESATPKANISLDAHGKKGTEEEQPESQGLNAEDGESSTTLAPRILVVLWLLVLTGPLLILGDNSIRKLESLSTNETTQTWSTRPGVLLLVGPEAFVYDSERELLTHRGPVTKTQQEELRALIQFADSVTEAQRSEIRATYELAVDKLSFSSRLGATEILMWLLIVGGVFGALGSLARIYSNFLLVACYRGGKGFNLKKWWPYYVLLPALGFLMGLFVTVLLKANLLTVENQSPAGNLWWAGISIIVGFGAVDVSERLKSLGKAMFGTSKKV